MSVPRAEAPLSGPETRRIQALHGRVENRDARREGPDSRESRAFAGPASGAETLRAGLGGKARPGFGASLTASAARALQ